MDNTMTIRMRKMSDMRMAMSLSLVVWELTMSLSGMSGFVCGAGGCAMEGL